MILAIETSTPRAGLALWDGTNSELIRQETFVTQRAHNSVIFGLTQKLLAECNGKPRHIAVGLGPGSYSGVRVGIAVANGLGLALEVGTSGVSSLLAYGDQESVAGNYAVVGDARRGTRFVATVLEGRLGSPPELIPEGDLGSRLDELLQSGLVNAVFTPDRAVADDFASVELSQPSAAAVARIGWDQFKARDTPDTGNPDIPLEPHYLRSPYVTSPKKR